MAEHLPDIEVYTKRLNWYLQKHYPANKKISAEEWNALFIALMNQGNAQEETLAKICNAILPQHVSKINRLIDITTGLNERITSLDTAVLHPHNLHEGAFVNLVKSGTDVTISFNAGAAINEKLEVGETTTGPAGSEAAVSKSLKGDKTTLNFTVPMGPQGEPGFGWIALDVKDGNLIVHTKEMDPKDFVIGPDGYMRINVKEEI